MWKQLHVSDAARNLQTSPLQQLRSIKWVLDELSETNPTKAFHIVCGNDFHTRMRIAIASLALVNEILHPLTNSSRLAASVAFAIANKIKSAHATLDNALDLPTMGRSDLDGQRISSSRIRNSLEKREPHIHGLPDELTAFILDRGVFNFEQT